MYATHFFFHHHVFIRHWLSASASCSHLLSYTSFSRFCFGISLCLRLCTAIRSFPMQSYRKYFSVVMFCCCFLRGKRQMPSQCSGQIKKIAIFIWTNDNRMHINLTVLHFQSIIDSGFTIDVFMCVFVCLSIRFTAKL